MMTRVSNLKSFSESEGVAPTRIEAQTNTHAHTSQNFSKDFPEYQSQLKRIIDRLVDLMVPFQKKYYYTPEMKGIHSIKSVLKD